MIIETLYSTQLTELVENMKITTRYVEIELLKKVKVCVKTFLNLRSPAKFPTSKMREDRAQSFLQIFS